MAHLWGTCLAGPIWTTAHRLKTFSDETGRVVLIACARCGGEFWRRS